MRKILALALCLFTSIIPAMADDHTAPKTDWSHVNAVEMYLENHPDLSPEEVVAQFPEAAENLRLDGTQAISTSLESDLPLGIPPFIWGCCFGLLGVILVILVTDNDKTQTRKALYGCLTAAGVAVGLYLILLISGAAWVSFS